MELVTASDLFVTASLALLLSLLVAKLVSMAMASDPNTHNSHHQQQQQHLLSPNLPPEEFHHKEDDLIAELTHHMDRFLLQDHHHNDHHDKYDFSSQLSWDLMASPQSTLWSPLPSEASS